MKAIVRERYGSAEVLELRDVARPEIGDKQVLVRVEAAGVDRGAWHMMTGEPRVMRLVTGLRKPRSSALGMDLAGEIVAVGARVTEFAVGDQVFGTGTGAFAEYATAKPGKLARRPAGVTAVQAAAVPVSGATGLLAVRTAKVQKGQSVLVIGAGGGVGAYAVQLARLAGARVTAVCSGGKADLVRSLGAEAVIDYTRTPLTGRYDAIVDIAGNRPLPLLRSLLTPAGTLVLVGAENGGAIFGGLGRNFHAKALDPWVKHRLKAPLSITATSDLEHLATLLVTGDLVAPVDRTYPLAEAADAIRSLEAGRVAGKLALEL
ncbi:NAD(P)-dependent alcohol dehydrogenase [Hamadaea sp. NPDC050747]|uniref:NAD(P)-dependent alcohol dehydrogenase n=1 Tax=Hamadaea sp. NPDC050747 TaxID=3155789 RepID=UPI0033D9EF4C